MPQFQPGHSGNPGGRPAHQTKYLKSLVRLVKQSDWRDIVLKAIEQAKRGDKSAREFLADYCLGKPLQPIELEQYGDQKILVEYVNQIGTTISAHKPDSDNPG